MMFTMRIALIFAMLALPLFGAEKLTVRQLIDLSRKPNDMAFAEGLRATFPDKALKEATAVLGEGPDFIWTLQADHTPELYVDDEKVGTLKPAGKSGLWF